MGGKGSGPVSTYDVHKAKLVVDSLASGKTMEDSAQAAGVHLSTVREWFVRDVQFHTACLRAREFAADLSVDNLERIAESEPDVNRARLRCDNIKWRASKHNPKVYGDRIDVNHSGNIDISAALNEASQRALRPIRDLQNIEDAQLVEIPRLSDQSVTGSEPAANDLELEDLLS